jgi:hypothetical protein
MRPSWARAPDSAAVSQTLPRATWDVPAAVNNSRKKNLKTESERAKRENEPVTGGTVTRFSLRFTATETWNVARVA